MKEMGKTEAVPTGINRADSILRNSSIKVVGEGGNRKEESKDITVAKRKMPSPTCEKKDDAGIRYDST